MDCLPDPNPNPNPLICLIINCIVGINNSITVNILFFILSNPSIVPLVDLNDHEIIFKGLIDSQPKSYIIDIIDMIDDWYD